VTGVSARTARLLVLLVVPGQLMFVILVYVIRPHRETIEITPLFAIVYLTAAVVQVIMMIHC